MLEPLGNYGGPTVTMLPLPGSAAICAGSTTLVPTGLAIDQRGFPLNTANCSNGGVDAGAVQTNYVRVNTLTDANDGNCTSAVCSLRDAITLGNSNGTADIAFTSSVTGTTRTCRTSRRPKRDARSLWECRL
jgi:CSLREA domain-containing protein